MIYLVMIYLIQFVFVYSSDFAYFQGKWPSLAEAQKRQDFIKAISVAVAISWIPIVPIIFSYFLYDRLKYGFKFR